VGAYDNDTHRYFAPPDLDGAPEIDHRHDALVAVRRAMEELNFRAMGCEMFVALDRDDRRAAAQLAAAPGWFEEWEQQLSRFRDDSDLARLNAAGRPVAVRDALWEVIREAIRAARESDGLVRPTMLGALEAAGYDRSFDAIGPELENTPSTHGRVPPASFDWSAIGMDPRTHAVTLPAGTRLDLGGVAKGWAAGQAARRLAAAGPALVDAGGDIAVSGPMADGSPWPIAIADPFRPEGSLGTLLIVRGAAATSGREYRRWRRGGAEQHHIIDPRTGRPARTDVLTATVVAPDGPAAEVAAKVALILGSREGLAWIDARPTLAGLLVLEGGRVVRSRRIDAYLERAALV
jgi:thiamine biosynthesis lipoprotein